MIFYDGDSMANTLSLKDVANIFCITMDTNKQRKMLVHMNTHTILRFSECGDGFYYYNTSIGYNVTNGELNNYYYLSTVAKNKHDFTRKEFEGADIFRYIQLLIRWSLDKKYS